MQNFNQNSYSRESRDQQALRVHITTRILLSAAPPNVREQVERALLSASRIASIFEIPGPRYHFPANRSAVSVALGRAEMAHLPPEHRADTEHRLPERSVTQARVDSEWIRTFCDVLPLSLSGGRRDAASSICSGSSSRPSSREDATIWPVSCPRLSG